jgi:predicted MFS family arabinose efflux permease
MRTIIAALEEMGMIARKPHATDGRQVNLELTAKGAAVQKSVGDAKRTWLAQAIAQARRTGTRDAVRGRQNHQAPGRKATPNEKRTQPVTSPITVQIHRKPSLPEVRCRTPGEPAAPQLQALLLRPEHLRDRHLDDPAGDNLAGLSPDPFGAAAWHRQLFRADCFVSAGAICRRLGRAPRPPQAAGLDTSRCRRQSLALAALTWRTSSPSGRSSLSPLAGLDQCLRHAWTPIFLVQMVDDRNDLSNAIAINSSMANGARLIGPAIAGLVIAAFGEGWCFLIDGLSYFAVIASLLLMRIKPLDLRRSKASMFEQMREGWDYVRTFRPIRTILLLFSLVSLMGYSYVRAAADLRRQVLHGGATTLGWLMGASGIGALASGAFTGSPQVGRRAHAHASDRSAMLGGALILFGLSHTLWLSLVLMVFVGFGLLQTASASNTIIQSLVPEDKRARAMSYYTMAFFGAAPFGSLLAGALADRIGAPHTVIVTGAFCIAGSLWFTLELPKDQRRHAADLSGDGPASHAATSP